MTRSGLRIACQPLRHARFNPCSRRSHHRADESGLFWTTSSFAAAEAAFPEPDFLESAGIVDGPSRA
jgi:hypothetical protein